MAHEGYEFDPNEPDCSDGDFYCRICDASMNSEAMWSSHIVGKKHIKKVTQGPRVIFKRKFDEVDDESYDKPPKTERLDSGIKVSRWGSSDFPHKDQEGEYYPKKWGEDYMYNGSNPRSNPEACDKSYSDERHIEKGPPVYGPRNFDEDYPQRPWDKRDLVPRNSYLFKPKKSYDYGHKKTLSDPDPALSAAFDISQSSSLPFKNEIVNSLAFEEIINDIFAHRKVNDIKVTDQRVTDAPPLQVVEDSRKTIKETNDDQDSQQKVDEKIPLKRVGEKVPLKSADEKVIIKRIDDKAVHQKDNRGIHERIDEHITHPRDGNKITSSKDDRNSRRYDDRDIHQRGADKESPHEKDYDHRSSRRKEDDKSSYRRDEDKSTRRRDDDKSVHRKDDDKSSHRKDDDKSIRRRDDDKSSHRKDDDKSARRRDDDKSVHRKDDKSSHRKDDDKGSRQKSTDDRPSRYKDDDKGSHKKSTDDRHYKDSDRDSHLRDRDRNLRTRNSGDRDLCTRSNDEKGLRQRDNDRGSRQRDDDRASRQRNSEDKVRQRDSGERNARVRSSDDKASCLRNSDAKNICPKVKDKISSDEEDIDEKIVKKTLSNGKILHLRINSTASHGKSVDVDKDDNEEYDKELLELLKQYNDDVLLLEDDKEKTKAVERHISCVPGDKSSSKKDLRWNEVDPERLSPSELDNLLSSYLKPKADAPLKVKNDSPEDISSRLDTLPNKIFLKAVLKKVDNLIIKDWEELNMLSEIIVKAQSVLCSKLPPHLQDAIRQKMSGRQDEKGVSRKTPGSLNNPVVSQSPAVSTHSVQIPLSHSTQNVPVVSTVVEVAPNSTAIPTQLSASQNSCIYGSTQPLPSVFQNKPTSLEQKSSANSSLLQPSYQLPAVVQKNPALLSFFQKKCGLVLEPSLNPSLNSTQLPSQLTTVAWNNQLTMQNSQLPAVIQNNKLPVATQNNRLPVTVQNNMISILQNKSGVSVEQKLSLLNNTRPEVPSKLLAATQGNPLQPSVLHTLSNSSEQASPSIYNPQLQPCNQQYGTVQNNTLLSMFLNKNNSSSEQKRLSLNSPQSFSNQPPPIVQNNQPLFSVLQKIASSVSEENSSLNSHQLQSSNQLPSTIPNNPPLPSLIQKIIGLSEQNNPSVNSSLSEPTNQLLTARQKNPPSVNSPQSEPSNKLPIKKMKMDFTNQTSSTSDEKLKSNSASSNEAVSNVSGNTISYLTSKMIDALIAKKVLPSSALESSVFQKVSNFISEKLKQSLSNSDFSSASSSSDINTLANAQAPCQLDAEKLWEKYFIK